MPRNSKPNQVLTKWIFFVNKGGQLELIYLTNKNSKVPNKGKLTQEVKIMHSKMKIFLIT